MRVAAEVVAEVGYSNASVARIAARAGISKGVITYHFVSKDEILRGVALGFLERCSREVQSRIDGAQSATEAVHGWVRGELLFFAEHRVESIAMVEIMANHRDPEFVLAFDDEAAAETQRLVEILRRGQQASEFRPFDPNTVAQIILRCRDGILDSWGETTADALADQIDTLVSFIDHAIAART